MKLEFFVREQGGLDRVLLGSACPRLGSCGVHTQSKFGSRVSEGTLEMSAKRP